MELRNDTKLISLIRQLTLAQQHQALERLKDLNERKQVSEYKKSLLRDPHQITP